MSVMLPHRRSTAAIVGLLLVDLPVLLAVAIVGAFYGYVHTYETVMAWRTAHPLSFVPSVALAAVLVIRWRRAR